MYGKITHIGNAPKNLNNVENNNNITQNLLERIERYHTNAMTPEERLEFEKELQTDPNFKTQVEEVRKLMVGIETQALKEQLNEFHKGITDHKPNQSLKFISTPILKYAAVAIVLIAIGNYCFFGTPSHEKLFNQYFKPDPGLPTAMGSTENYDFYDAMVNYKRGDYKIAISKWEKIHQTKPENDTINYFMGLALLSDNNVEKAIPYLTKTANDTESKFNNDANFYLGLAYLKSNDKDAAITYFKRDTSEKSKELLDKLK
jgi:tetratricopeptide (TPR) repeat protein